MRELPERFAIWQALAWTVCATASLSLALGMVVAVFGPTDERATRPIGPRSEVITEPVFCRPCMLRDCPIDHRCMTWISVEEVFRTAEVQLAATDEKYDDAACSIS